MSTNEPISENVVENIDELYLQVTDAALLMEAQKYLRRSRFEEGGMFTRQVLKNLNASLDNFDEIFKTIGIPGERAKS